MKIKSTNRTKKLNLISVLIKDINNQGNPQIKYDTIKEIVSQITIEKVKVLTKEIIKIMPFEALKFYFNELKPLITISVIYNYSGDYSIEVESAPAIFQNFNKELDEITTMLDNVIISF